MPEFRYTARDTMGKRVDGALTVQDRAMVIQQLERQGLVPISIDAPGEAQSTVAKRKAEVERVDGGDEPITTLRHSHQHLFTEQLAYLLGAGMTLDEALAVLMRRLKHPQLQSLSKGLHHSLVEGRSLSQALRDYPRIFSPLYVNLVSAGEASGALPEILERLVGYLAEVKMLRDRVKQALLYPAVLIFAGFGLVVTFMTVMVPKLTGFFSSTQQVLPPATQLLMSTNKLIVNYWWVAVLGCAGIYAGWKSWTSQAEGRRIWDTLIWHMPITGKILRYRFYAQFARTLGTLMENGVTLLKSLELLEEISGNSYARQRMEAARRAVVDGATLSTALAEQKLFPDLLVDMMAVGEQTGKFGGTMQMIGRVYERELDQQVQVVSTLVPPLVMMVVAGVVGFVVYGIMSAVFGLTQNLRGGVH